MDSTNLTKTAFWQSGDSHVFSNPRDQMATAEAKLLHAWLGENEQLAGSLIFSTSGSTGKSKWVVHDRDSLLISAKAVNDHLEVKSSDVWLQALPSFHVGGLGIIARAYLSGSKVISYEGKWNTTLFCKQLEQCQISLTSLVPTQVNDLVTNKCPPPKTLRAVLVGGGALEDSVFQAATHLGWPLIETYGMTEAGSQIATASAMSRQMKVLPIWQTRVSKSGILSIKGAALFKGFVVRKKKGFFFEKPFRDSWYQTSDCVVLRDGEIVFECRADRVVKVLGELVDLSLAERELRGLLRDENAALVAVPDSRRGAKLVLCSEQEFDSGIVESYNTKCNPVARVQDFIIVDHVPRAELGKIRYNELEKKIESQI